MNNHFENIFSGPFADEQAQANQKATQNISGFPAIQNQMARPLNLGTSMVPGQVNGIEDTGLSMPTKIIKRKNVILVNPDGTQKVSMSEEISEILPDGTWVTTNNEFYPVWADGSVIRKPEQLDKAGYCDAESRSGGYLVTCGQQSLVEVCMSCAANICKRHRRLLKLNANIIPEQYKGEVARHLPELFRYQSSEPQFYCVSCVDHFESVLHRIVSIDVV